MIQYERKEGVNAIEVEKRKDDENLYEFALHRLSIVGAS
jgi:hypothetical protein